MELFLETWYIWLGFAAVITCFVLAIWRHLQLPTEEQLDKVREWLLWAVTEAEMELGNGTGQLKLRSVYDLFILRWPKLAKVVSFDLFSALVDDALDEMRTMLNQNKAVKEIVEVGIR